MFLITDDSLCLHCIYKISQYNNGEFDCSLYGRVKDIEDCDTFSSILLNISNF